MEKELIFDFEEQTIKIGSFVKCNDLFKKYNTEKFWFDRKEVLNIKGDFISVDTLGWLSNNEVEFTE